MGLQRHEAKTISGHRATGHCFKDPQGRDVILFDNATIKSMRSVGYIYDGDYAVQGTIKMHEASR